jgi:hypothetical protein
MILTPDELREHITTDLATSALQRLLDAAEFLIVDRAGAAGTRTEIVGGGTRFLTVTRPIASITSITETLLNDSRLLAANDYRLRYGGYLIERMIIGTNGRFRWWGDATVVYEPIDDSALRATVQIDLCRLAIDYHPGLTAETIGAWSQQFGSNSVWNNHKERESILSSLDPDMGMLVVGTPSVWITQ